MVMCGVKEVTLSNQPPSSTELISLSLNELDFPADLHLLIGSQRRQLCFSNKRSDEPTLCDLALTKLQIQNVNDRLLMVATLHNKYCLLHVWMRLRQS